MANRSHNGFFAILIPMSLMSLVIFNAGLLKRTGKNIYVYLHRESHLVKNPKTIYGRDGETNALVQKLLPNWEVTKDASAVPIFTGVDDKSKEESYAGVKFSENRVLYKFNRARLDPSYECVIKILKYRRPKAEEVFTNHDKWVRSGCDDVPCSVEARYSLNLDDFWESDVVVLMPGRFESYVWDRLLAARPPGQLWALYTKESPVHEPQLTPPAELFTGNPYNLSMTFRSGSDIDLSYGRFVPGVDTTKKFGEKTKLMMWMASRCDPLGWERTKFVKELQKYFQIDIYGKCGTFECPKHDWDSCLAVMKQYKFYLALENSECAEYITEKFWSNAYFTGMVPIAYGAFKEDYARIAPPNSFIHLNDFNTMEEFVDYINLLDRNDTLYESYFEWRKLGKVYMGPGFRTALSPPSLCNMIKKLVDISLNPENSWRGRTPDFSAWWGPTCRHQTELLGVKI